MGYKLAHGYHQKYHQNITHRRDTTRLMAVCVSSVVLRVSLLGTNLLTWSGIIETNDPKKTANASSGRIYIHRARDVGSTTHWAFLKLRFILLRSTAPWGWLKDWPFSSVGPGVGFILGDLEMLAKCFTKNMSGKINLNRNPIRTLTYWFIDWC